MRRLVHAIQLVSGLLLCLPSPAIAAAGYESAPVSQEVLDIMSLTRQAAQLVTTQGEEAFATFSKPGTFLTPDTYVFVHDFDGNTFVNPNQPEMVGHNNLDLKDADGKLIIRSFIERLTAGRSGAWVYYKLAKTAGAEPTWKTSFIIRARAPSGKEYIVGTGRHEVVPDRTIITDTVDRAVNLLQSHGRVGFSVLRDKTQQFLFQDVYVFVIDTTGFEWVNAGWPDLEGTNRLDATTPDGRLFIRDMVKLIQRRASGWIDYTAPYFDGGTRHKYSYIRRAVIDGQTMLVGAGRYQP